MNAAAATALADQHDAASADVASAMDRLVLERGYLPSTTRPDGWLLALLADAVSAPCPHLAGMQAPAPVFITPHLRAVECEPCHRRSALAMVGTAEDDRCDRCRLTPHDRRLTTMAAAFGPVCIPMGLCAACVPAVDGSTR